MSWRQTILNTPHSDRFYRWAGARIVQLTWASQEKSRIFCDTWLTGNKGLARDWRVTTIRIQTTLGSTVASIFEGVGSTVGAKIRNPTRSYGFNFRNPKSTWILCFSFSSSPLHRSSWHDRIYIKPPSCPHPTGHHRPSAPSRGQQPHQASPERVCRIRHRVGSSVWRNHGDDASEPYRRFTCRRVAGGRTASLACRWGSAFHSERCQIRRPTCSRRRNRF